MSGSLLINLAALGQGILAGGTDSGIVEIYKHNGSEYQHIQNVHAGFPIYSLAVSRERLLVAGYSSEIEIYGFDGVEYGRE